MRKGADRPCPRLSRRTHITFYLLFVSLTLESIYSEPLWNAKTLLSTARFSELFSFTDELLLSTLDIQLLDFNDHHPTRNFIHRNSKHIIQANNSTSHPYNGYHDSSWPHSKSISYNILSKLRAGGDSTAYSINNKQNYDTHQHIDAFNIQPNTSDNIHRDHFAESSHTGSFFRQTGESSHYIKPNQESQHFDSESEIFRRRMNTNGVTDVSTTMKKESSDRESRRRASSLDYPIDLASSMDDSKYYSDASPLQTKQQDHIKNHDSTHSYVPNMYHDFSIQPLDPNIPDLPPILNQDLSVESDPDSFQNQDEEEEFSSQNHDNEEEELASTEEDDEKYPVIYRYFGRSRTRSLRYESTPYIILCHNVDHFKVVGQILSSRGFNTMVCQRVLSDPSKVDEDPSTMGTNKRNSSWDIFPWNRNSKPTSDTAKYRPTDGSKLVLAILEVLKWKKAVLVGCGAEAILAIEAALKLAPNRVAGLIICGDLTSAHEHASEFLEDNPSVVAPFQERDRSLYGPWSLDKLLQDYIYCPATIIWDGDSTALISSKVRGDKNSLLDGPMKSSIEQLEAKRCIIIGGGSAPYRKLPEQFSWACTRFVEKELTKIPVSTDEMNKDEVMDDSLSENGYDDEEYEEAKTDLESSTRPDFPSFWSHIVPNEMTQAWKEIFNPGSLVVSGRLVASVIIYFTLARVTVFHYKNAAQGLAGLRTSCLSLSTWWKQIASFLLSFIPVLSKDVAPSNGIGNINASENSDITTDDVVDDESDKKKSPVPGEDSASDDDTTVRKLFFYDQIFT